MGHESFLKNTAWQYGLQLIKYLLPLVTLPYLTRVLEPEGYAIYAYVLSFMTFAQVIVDFGFNLSGTKQIARAGNGDVSNKIFGSITQARLVLCLFVAIGVAAIGSFIPIIRENLVYSALAYVAVCGRAMAPDFIFQGKERMGTLTTRYFVSKGTSTVLTFIFVHSATDLLWIPVLDIVASIIAFVWSIAAVRSEFGIRITWVPFKTCWDEIAHSGYYCLSNLASSSLNGLTTLVIGVAITDSAQIAYWSLAMTAVTAVQSLYTPITNSLYPHMVVGSDYRFAQKLALIAFPFLTIGTVIFVFAAHWIALVLGGEQYLNGVWIMQLVAPVLWFSFYSMYFGWPVMGAIGKVRELTVTTVISGAVGVTGLLGLWSFGLASIAAFAIVRNIAEIVLCALRVVGAHSALKEHDDSAAQKQEQQEGLD